MSHLNWSPAYAGGTHTPLPLPGRGLAVIADGGTAAGSAKGLAYTWIVDVRTPENPVTIATMPTPTGEDFCNKGGKFGPHNLHENRPGSFQSETLIFATYHNAGVRVFDISTAHEPKETAFFAPGPPEKIVDKQAWRGTRGAVDRRVRRYERPYLRDGYEWWTEYPAIRGIKRRRHRHRLAACRVTRERLHD